MRVLHVIDSLGVGGGAEHSLATMLPLLRDRGTDSSVVTLYPREGGLQEQLRRQGFDVRTLAAGSWPQQLRALRDIIRHRDPQIVHASLYNSCVLTRFACRGLAVRQLNSLVSTPYDPIAIRLMGIRPWRARVVQEFDSLTARLLGDHFHAVSRTVRVAATRDLRIDPASVTVIPRGRPDARNSQRDDALRLEVRRRLDISPTSPVILAVGREDPQKDHPTLVTAFGSVLRQLPDAVLLIAGRPGSASRDITETVALLDRPERVHRLGHRTDVQELSVAADVLACASLYEGLPGAVIEAMAVGLPVVGSDAPSVQEVLDGGNLGLIVERGDSAGLAGALIRLLDDEGLRRNYASKARAVFEERYLIDGVADRTLALYEGLLAPTR